MLDRAMIEAENALRGEEMQIAESRYRSALLEAWMLRGAVAALAGDLDAARSAYDHALRATTEIRRPRTALALVYLEAGEFEAAIDVLRNLKQRNAASPQVLRFLAQALTAAGHSDEGLSEIEKARALTPDDLEHAFLQATLHLHRQEIDLAEKQFSDIAEQRPLPQTWILIGRTWRDYKAYDRARDALQHALEIDPQVRRGHYYLGTIEVLVEGLAALETAIGHFERELLIAPEDPITHLYLGIAHTEARRFEKALPSLELATRSDSPGQDAFYYLGKAYLGLDRPADAVVAMRQALEQAAGSPERDLTSIHYQLAIALRRSGDPEAAAPHFEAAQKHAEQLTRDDRARLQSYLRDEIDQQTVATRFPSPLEVNVLRGLDTSERQEIVAQANTALARANLNLGILHMQSERFARAAEHFAEAAEADPEFPKVWYSLGLARYNAGQYLAATEPLHRALTQTPDDSGLRRMLALAWLNSETYDRAAELLADDPELTTNPSLQYSYGLALVRSAQSAAARQIFDRLINQHADWPDLHVLLGQTHAQEGNFSAAIASLEHALVLKSDVADAHGNLGIIYLRQGDFAAAEKAFRAELAIVPEDLRSRFHLATVLDLNRQSAAAVEELRTVLTAQPAHADARYLLGKILLTGGEIEAAVEQLEIAAELTPEKAEAHYQLGQAYQKLGQAERAQQHFAVFRQLKAKEREPSP